MTIDQPVATRLEGRSLAWRLVFQASDRTLTDDEVNTIHARVVRRVCDEFHISLRGV